MNRTEKSDAVTGLTSGLGKATNAFLLDFKGITVPQVTELRRQIRETSSEYLVVKNTLALIATKDSPLVALKEQFKGPTAIAFNHGDPVALAKALTKFAKETPNVIKFKAAMLDGRSVEANQIEAIANLPSKTELVSKLLFMLQSPMRNIALVLNANIRNLAVVLGQVSEKKGGGAATEAAQEAAPVATQQAAAEAAPEKAVEAAPEPAPPATTE